MTQSEPNRATVPKRLAAIRVGVMGTLSLVSILAGCDLGSGPPPEPASLVAITPVDQATTVATAVSAAPAVRVLNKKGKPMARREVVFTIAGGGGQVVGGIQVTDAEGAARVGSWVLGTAAGVNTLQASVVGLAPVVFTAAGSAAAPATMTIQGEAERQGVVGSALAPSPAVLVRDAYGNPVGGLAIEFQVTSGGGSVEGGNALTDVQGLARVASWTLGTSPGPNVLSASVSGLPPVTFVANGVADAPSLMTVFQGDQQSATVGSPVPLPPSVRVADRFGNLLQGVPVEFEVASGSGALQGENAVTDFWGIAAVESWTLGTTAGIQVLVAKVAGVDPVTISARAKAGPPAVFLAHAGEAQTGTVGAPVAVPPAVLVQDGFGNPVPGIAVTFSEAGWSATGSQGPGRALVPGEPQSSSGTVAGHGSPSATHSLTGGDAITDSTGVAGVESWTLGTVAGTYQLTSVVSGMGDPLVFTAVALPDVPWTLEKVEGDGQSVRVGSAVPLLPAVRVTDRYANAVGGVQVVFSVLEGGGVVTGDTAVTDSDGRATPGSWTLGSDPGANSLGAALADVGSVTFVATGLVAVPVAVTRVSGDGQTAPVGTPVPVNPRVRVTDAEGGGVPLVAVTFSVILGEGSVTGSAVLTDDDGRAEVGSWTLGTVAGTNRLQAAVSGLTPVVFSATGSPGPPASMTVNGGDGQTAQAGTVIPIPPSVRVRDSFANPVPGVAVTFSVLPGEGSVTGSPAWTNSSGVAGVTTWTLGPDPGVNTLTATTVGVEEVVFTATATASPPPSEFAIELQFMTSIDPAQEAIFREAAARWEEVIVGDLPDFTGVLPAGGCQPVEETGGVDDVKIYVSIVPIDGVGGVLGQAGPCYVWNPDERVLPITGIVRLDEADVAKLQADGMLKDVIIHEMGHVLGIGTLWNVSPNAFLVGGGGSDPYFDGPAAVAAFDAAGGSDRPTPKVPVENTGGAGTRDSHWRETVLNSELMTGWIEPPGTLNPLSTITIASLADMGYIVNMSAADPYTVFSPLAAPPQEMGDRLFLQELPPPTPIFIDPPRISRAP